jgi:uncharacterized membrane protein SpoIIM required for sporulation
MDSETTTLPSGRRRFHPRRVWHFALRGFPGAAARTWRCHLAAGLLFLHGVVLGYVATRQDPAATTILRPAGFPRTAVTRDGLLAVLREGRDAAEPFKFAFAGYLFGHNLKAGVVSVLGGVLGGIPSVLFAACNGLTLGAVTALYHGQGIYAEFWAWVLPHGVTEILALVLCAGAGLHVGIAVVAPGPRSRFGALHQAVPEAARILAGVAGMLLAAALAESYVRHSDLSVPLRLVFAGATAVLWAAYFARGPRAAASARTG